MYWYEVEQAHEKQIKRRIKLVVLALHVLLFWCIAYTTVELVAKNRPKKLAVRTVKLNPQSSAPKQREIAQPKVEAPVEIKQSVEAVQETAAPPAAPEPKIEPVQIERVQVESAQAEHIQVEPAPVESAPTPRKETKAVPIPKAIPKPSAKPTPKAKPVSKPAPKPAAKPKAAEKPKPAAKTQQNAKEKAKQEQLKKEKAEAQRKSASLADALASLDRSGALNQKKASVASKISGIPTNAPVAIGPLSSDSLVAIVAEEGSLTGPERTYQDELIRRMQLSLRLPEFGDVTLQLTISRAGKVLSVKSVKSSSKKNVSYVEKSVPPLTFPAFGQNFSGEKEHTFQIRLTKGL